MGCSCVSDAVSGCVVMDLFCGSGTTGVVALRNRRKFIGIDGKQEYINLANNRLIREKQIFEEANAS